MQVTKETLENLEQLNPEERKQVSEIVMSSPRYKELQSSTTKGVQLITEAAEFFVQYGNDVEKLKELQGTKPDVFEKVMTKFHKVKSLDEVQPKEDIDAKVQKAVLAEKINNRIDTYMSQLSDDDATKFKEKFEFLSKGKELTLDTVDELAKAAMALTNPSVDLDKEMFARMSASGKGNKTSSGADENSKKEALKQQWKSALGIKN